MAKILRSSCTFHRSKDDGAWRSELGTPVSHAISSDLVLGAFESSTIRKFSLKFSDHSFTYEISKDEAANVAVIRTFKFDYRVNSRPRKQL